MSKIPTAEEFLNEHHQISHYYDDKGDQMVVPDSQVQQAMIEFAKLHVKAALEAEHKNMQLPEEDLEFTLSSYDLNEIK